MGESEFSNYDLGLTLTYFFIKVKFGHIGFCMEESDFFKLLQP